MKLSSASIFLCGTPLLSVLCACSCLDSAGAKDFARQEESDFTYAASLTEGEAEVRDGTIDCYSDLTSA